MNYNIGKNLRALLIIVFLLAACENTDSGVGPEINNNPSTAVEYYGRIQVKGNKIVDKNENPVALRGMSLFWSQWGGSFYNEKCVQWLRDDWKCTVVRASMGVESGGYLTNAQSEYQKIITVIDACIKYGIYVVVDWHDHNAQDHLTQAKSFFGSIAQKYGDKPNIIYEIYNEPLQVSWSSVIKPYAVEVIKSIRQYDPDNLIVVGNPNWSQDVDVAAKDPVDDVNVAYSLHFYTSTHRQWLRSKAIAAMNSGAALFVTEFGISEASGNGNIDMTETNLWMNFLETYKLSSCNWSVIDKNETSASLKTGADPLGGWTQSALSQSGIFNRDYIISKNKDLFEILNSAVK
ncbi:MAG: glycoside hydrolase family 5 protein [Melioribacteraceae bacterium]